MDERNHPTRSIASFWLVSLLGPLGGALVVRAFTDSLSPLVSTIIIAAAMPAPLAAAMLIGRTSPRQVLAGVLDLQGPVATVLLPVAAVSVWFACAMALTAVFGDVFGVDQAGHVARDVEAVRANLAQFDAELAATAEIPPVALLVPLALGGGIVAGFTVNGYSPSARSTGGGDTSGPGSLTWGGPPRSVLSASCGVCGMLR